MPRVNVVITAFNAARLIGETLDSVLAQTYRDFEVVVVDGGSTDETVEVVSRYGTPVRLIEGECLTKSAGRNLGIRAAQGEYIALVDADDLWLPDKLSRQIDYLTSSPSNHWVYSDCYLYDGSAKRAMPKWSDRNHLYSGDILERLLFDCFVPSATPVFRRTVFETVGVFDESFLRHEPEDWDLWLRVAARFPAGIIDEPLAKLRVHASSLTAQEDVRLTADGVIAVVDRAFVRNPHLPARLRRQVFLKWYLCLGRGLAGEGRTSEARAFLLKAMQNSPLRLSAYVLWSTTWLGGGVLRRLRDANHAFRRLLARRVLSRSDADTLHG